MVYKTEGDPHEDVHTKKKEAHLTACAINPVFTTVLGSFLACMVGVAVAILSDYLTRQRERQSGIVSRRREFIVFMWAWRMKMDVWYLNSGWEHHSSDFHDFIPAYKANAELIHSDFVGDEKKQFEVLMEAITSRGNRRYAYKHEEVLEAIEKLIAFVEASIHTKPRESK